MDVTGIGDTVRREIPVAIKPPEPATYMRCLGCDRIVLSQPNRYCPPCRWNRGPR